MLVAVRFLIPFANYNIGDVAGFTEERAQAMVKSKIAELFVVPKPTKAGKAKTEDSSDAP